MTQELSQTALAALMLTALTVGFVFGAIYDLLRIRRIACKKGKSEKKHLTSFIEAFIIGIEDILFFIFLGCVTSVMYYVFSSGRVRLLAILCEFIGFIIYRLTLGRLVMLVSDIIISFIYFLWRKFVAFVIMPPVNFAKKTASKVFASIARSYRKVGRRRFSNKMKKSLIKASRGGMLGF